MQHFEFGWQTEDGLQLYAQGWQPDTEPRGVICLVHGLGEHSGRYAHLAAFLNQAGYALLTFDLRGHGKSEGRRGHVHPASSPPTGRSDRHRPPPAPSLRAACLEDDPGQAHV